MVKELDTNTGPLLYHGTPYTFTQFRVPVSGAHFGTLDQAAHACTLKLARLPMKVFETLERDGSGWLGRLMLVRLHITNAKRVSDARTAPAWSKAITKAKQEGYDALVYQNNFEGRQPEDSYVIFDASQVEVIDPYVNMLK